MRVFIAAEGGQVVPYLAGASGGLVGTMISPDTYLPRLYSFIPFAIDNGRYQSTVKNRKWDEAGFWKIIDKAKKDDVSPEFVVVPDIPFDADGTRREWDKWAPRLDEIGLPLAYAMQDGIKPQEVPRGVVAFIGGTTEYKKRIAPQCVDRAHKVHVGRVNRYAAMCRYCRLGISSVDGSGFLREGHGGEPIKHLTRFLKWLNNGRL